MAEISKYTFSFKEIVETLVKKQGLREGLWALDIRFGMQATNFGPNESDVKPTAIVPILEIGIQRVDKENNLTVDAAKLNPPSMAARPNPRSKPS